MMVSKKTCFIIANSIPPYLGGPSSGPGMRAEQLHVQAKLVFADVKIVMFMERMQMTLPRNGVNLTISTPSDFIVIKQSEFGAFVRNRKNAVFVFTQADFLPEAQIVAKRFPIVFDMIARKDLEFEFSGRTVQRDAYVDLEQGLFDLASIVFYNGDRKVDYVNERARKDCPVRHNKIAPVRLPFGIKPEQKYISFFGSEQAWVDSSKMLGAMCDYFRRDEAIHGMEFGSVRTYEYENDYSRYYSALTTSCKVNRLSKIHYTNYHEIISGSVCFADVCALTGERYYSTSWRLIQAVRAGVPILGTADTELDTYWKDFPGRLIKCEEISADLIAGFIQECLDGKYAKAVDAANADLDAVLNDATLFQGVL